MRNALRVGEQSLPAVYGAERGLHPIPGFSRQAVAADGGDDQGEASLSGPRGPGAQFVKSGSHRFALGLLEAAGEQEGVLVLKKGDHAPDRTESAGGVVLAVDPLKSANGRCRLGARMSRMAGNSSGVGCLQN